MGGDRRAGGARARRSGDEGSQTRSQPGGGASGRLVNWDRFNDLKTIQIPTLVISGKYDTMDPAYMAKMAHELPHGELAATNGGHMDMYDDQRTYFAKLLAFLRKED